MLTNADLSAIKKVIKQEVQGVEERLSAKIQGVEKRLNDKIQGVEERLSAKIAKTQETIDIVQSVVVKHHSNLEQRVTDLEEVLHNPKN